MVGVSVSNLEKGTVSSEGLLMIASRGSAGRRNLEVELSSLMRNILRSVRDELLISLSRLHYLITVHFSRFDTLMPYSDGSAAWDGHPAAFLSSVVRVLGVETVASVTGRRIGCHEIIANKKATSGGPKVNRQLHRFQILAGGYALYK